MGPRRAPSGRRNCRGGTSRSWRGVVALLLVAYYFVARSRPEAAGPVAEPPVAASAADPPAPAPAPRVAPEPAVRPVVTAAAPPLPAGPAAHAAEHTTLAVALSASATCWMSITADGRTVASRLFAAGERVEASGDREVVVKVGDAAAGGH